MRNRFLSTAILVVALLLSAWGNVLAAAFCPHLGSAHACCAKHATKQSPSHEMPDMDMGDMPMEMSAEPNGEASPEQSTAVSAASVEQNTEANVVDQPVEACLHCMSHSQLSQASFVLRETEPSKRSVDTPAPQTAKIVSMFASASPIVTPREHAPPGESSPRYMFINIFRI